MFFMMPLLSKVLTLDPTSPVLSPDPIVFLGILLLVIFVVPILFERLRLPALVGLIGSGVVLGSSGWNLFESESSMISFLSDIGLVYLMFITGLELNLQIFRQQQGRFLIFNACSFVLPLILGTLGGRFFDFGWHSSILIGCLLSSYSLLAYPIINRLGLANSQAVSMTMSSTVFTNIATLLVLAVSIASFHRGTFGFTELIILLGRVIIYFIIFLVGFNWACKKFFRRYGSDDGNKFLCVLMSVFLAVVIAQLMGLTKIVGFFLAGLAVNEWLGEGLVKEKLILIGNVLFIPIFFIDLGSRIDLLSFFAGYGTMKLLLVILVGFIVSKLMTSVLAKLIYCYTWQETLTIWSLSVPLAGTTLAVGVGGYRSGLLSVEILNNAMILVLITATLGLWLTSLMAARYAVNLTYSSVEDAPLITLSQQELKSAKGNFNIIVPIQNPQAQKYLMEMAALLACQYQGKVLPLAIAHATSQMDAPQLDASYQRSEKLLAKAIEQSQLLGATAEPILRIDDALAPGICRAAREQNGNLIILSWGKRTGLRASLLGNVIDNVLWAAHCPVAVARLVESPKKIQRILVPIENLITPTLGAVQLAQVLANINQSHVTVLNACDRRTSASQIAARKDHLSQWVSNLAVPNPPEVEIFTHENPAQAILQAARLYDLVILPFVRNHTSPGGLAVVDMTTELAGKLTCSIILLREPQHNHKLAVSNNIPNERAFLQKY